MLDGFIRVAAASPKVRVGDVSNESEMSQGIRQPLKPGKARKWILLQSLQKLHSPADTLILSL